MPNVTLRDIPAEFHALLENARDSAGLIPKRVTPEDILEVARRAAALRQRDIRSDDEILGYGSDGLPD